MNALPVGIEQVADEQSMERYFHDLERWGFDLPCTAVCAHRFDDVTGRLKEPFSRFAARARANGYPACIQIPSRVCAGDRISIREAQYDVDNVPQTWGDGGFFASFASEEFAEYLQEFTSIFVREYYYDFVIFEEPIWRVDIPGTQDRFHSRFVALEPDLEYPSARRESKEYLAVQHAKTDMLVEFYTQLVAHVRQVGAVRVGIMPGLFIPSIENTPPGTLNTSCNIGRIAQIPGLDLLVAGVQPDNIYADTMRTGDDSRTSASLYHIELMAHNVGKDLMAISNPTDEHTEHPSSPLIPVKFYRDCVLASAAAAPGGFARHWYGQNYGRDDSHLEILTEAAAFAARLGQPEAAVAFVFSYSGTFHAEPYTRETVFPFYFELAKEMAFGAHIPMLTFQAETLENNLARHPEVRVLVLDEHFPLNPEQMAVINRWLQGSGVRAVVAFSSGLGYSADLNQVGLQPSAVSHPGLYELAGLRQQPDSQLVFDPPVPVKDVSRVKRSAFLDRETPLLLNKVSNVRRVLGSRVSVIYEVHAHEQHVPVVAEWKDGSAVVLFSGFGLYPDTIKAARSLIAYALKETSAPSAVIDSCSDGILWSSNRNQYVVVSNLSDSPGTATARPGRADIWDCKNKRFLPTGDPELVIEPRSFGVYRRVGRRAKYLDVEGACYLRSVIDGAGRAEIELWAGKTTTFLLRTSPKGILVDGRPSTVTEDYRDGICYVTLQQCPPGEHRISLRW